MRAEQGKLDLQPEFAPARPGDMWAVGHYFPSGKIAPTYYVYHLKTGHRAVDALKRRRKFKSYKSAFLAARLLNEDDTPRYRGRGM